ncbi:MULTISPECIES: response regulator transcription factor [unclassified Leptolyngbya]|uniref:response regulator n=1 Tax=unclassified Leptolyngbya TaxID=2650499 RepID=UPI0016865DC9|nr:MULTISPECIES: response regulator transcription factor [unclassified Leptolyngbya]MBD1913362.1 response regulator transcription factor [Leptolyngbya sp. FACHB-8]MBD2158707.1 response regulator transcription factor [Leptolyngbya sp. FACHB-16]
MQTSPNALIKLLLVDDDPMMRIGLKHSLMTQSQLEIAGVVEDGYLGVKAATELQPDVVVMDVGMPHMDGIAATQQIKQKHPEMKVIMLTSHTDQTEVVAALSSGADGYCVKGTSVEQLVKAIEVVYEGATYLDAQVAQSVITQLKTPTPATKKAPSTAAGTLSERELEVLQLIVEGYSNPDIAKALYLSEHTVKTYVRGILNKLLVNDRVQAAVTALRSGLVG